MSATETNDRDRTHAHMGAATVAAAKTTTRPLIFCTLFVFFFNAATLEPLAFQAELLDC